MNPERWRQIEEIYYAALERDPEGRAEFVAKTCGTDADLKKEVESLLAEEPSDVLLDRCADIVNEVASATNGMSPGAKLGPYELDRQLGAGGMGEVWRARDPRLGRMVALKVSSLGFNARFEQEARAVAALNHPHICTLYDIGPNYLVMEYVDGKALREVIPSKGMPVPEVLHYAGQIADALAAAHAAGIVHRDLKPANIMVTVDGRIKVVDFGIARLQTSELQGRVDPTSPVTVEGSIMGTCSYMSPEQAQGRTVDARSDIFSFGAVLYEMLTGVRAFHGESAISTLADIIHTEPRPASEITGTLLPREIEALLSRCLRKDPARRWQNMSDIKVALLDLKEDSVSGRLLPGPVPEPRRAGVSGLGKATKWGLLSGAIAFALLAAVGTGWYLARNRKPVNVAYTASPLTSYAGEQIQPSFSPDARQVAFAWNGPQRDNWDIYVKPVDAGEPVRLTSDPEDELAPAWSPDGQWIAFARMLPQNRYALNLISPRGGSERKLAEFGALRGDHLAFAWSADSKHIVLPVTGSYGQANGIFVMSVETGGLRQLTSMDPNVEGDRNPALSPDGRRLAFKRGGAVMHGNLYTLELTSDWSPKGPPRLVVADILSGPAWTNDGEELIYSTGPAPLAETLRRVAASGAAKPSVMGIPSNGAIFPTISYTGSGAPPRLAWTHRFRDSNIYELELAGRETRDPKPWIASSFRDVFPQYSPDGKSIALYSDSSGPTEIFVCQADGAKCRQVTNVGSMLSGSPRWSPDGRQIVFDSLKAVGFEVFVVDVANGVARQLTDGPFLNFSPNWSRDGKWIYFASNRGGTEDIWKMPAAGGAAQQVTQHGGIGASESPDGKLLYYAKAPTYDEASLWRAPVEGGKEERVVERIYRFSYTVTQRGIYFEAPFQSRAPGGTIEFLDTATGRRSLLVKTDKPLDLGVSVTPDERHLLFSQIDYVGSNLMMVENFR